MACSRKPTGRRDVNKKLPADAFAYYLSLGVSRSYAKVAKHFGVAKRTVTTLATAEKWQERVTEAEAKARDSAAENYVDTIKEMNSKHLKVLSFMLAKGLEGMKAAPVDDFTAAVRAVTVAIDRERLVRGEATNRSESVEQLVKREYARYLVPVDDDGESDDTAEEETNAGDGDVGEAVSA